tara:strand:+ start:4666 stop:6054 length:1389 start_codon:yes stop_codon:yes gene_type:complete
VANSSITKDKFFNIQDNPNLDAADTGVDSKTGQYLSKQERIKLFKKRRLNANKVFNRSSAIVKSDQKKDQSRGVLVKIVGSVAAVQLAVQKLTNFTKKSTETDAQNAKDDLREDKRADETDTLKEKEGKLEGIGKRLKGALLAPVESVKKTAQGILGKLAEVFKALFLGFIANKALKMIQAHMSGDKEGFKEMRNSIFKAFAVVGGIFLILKGGLMALPAIIGGLITSVIAIGGAILGFLISPAGLIALAVAAGIGGFLGLKKLFKNRNKKKDEEGKEIEKTDRGSGFADIRGGDDKVDGYGKPKDNNNKISEGSSDEKVDPYVVLENNKDLIPFGMYNMVKSEIEKDPSKYDTKEEINAALTKVGVDPSKLKYEGSNVKIDRVVKTDAEKTISRNQSNIRKEITNLEEQSSEVIDLTSNNNKRRKVDSKAVATTFPRISPRNLSNSDGYELYAIKAYGVFT